MIIGERSKKRIVKTPKHKIPIGEAVKNPDGHYSLTIKRSKGSDTEEVALDQLYFMVKEMADN